MIKGKRSWLHDAKKSEAPELIRGKTERNYENSPCGSRYETGDSRSGKPDEIGIYFFDPTAR
jgi:hypothetical protein